jgi:hypothetical protein
MLLNLRPSSSPAWWLSDDDAADATRAPALTRAILSILLVKKRKQQPAITPALLPHLIFSTHHQHGSTAAARNQHCENPTRCPEEKQF